MASQRGKRFSGFMDFLLTGFKDRSASFSKPEEALLSPAILLAEALRSGRSGKSETPGPSSENIPAAGGSASFLKASTGEALPAAEALRFQPMDLSRAGGAMLFKPKRFIPSNLKELKRFVLVIPAGSAFLRWPRPAGSASPPADKFVPGRGGNPKGEALQYPSSRKRFILERLERVGAIVAELKQGALRLAIEEELLSSRLIEITEALPSTEALGASSENSWAIGTKRFVLGRPERPERFISRRR